MTVTVTVNSWELNKCQREWILVPNSRIPRGIVGTFGFRKKTAFRNSRMMKYWIDDALGRKGTGRCRAELRFAGEL